MKTAPEVPGYTPWERMDNAVRAVFRVSKEDILKEEATLKRQKKRAARVRHGHAHARSKKRANAVGAVKKHQA